MANSQLTKTNPTANTDSRKKGTIAFWVKRSKLGTTQYIYTEYSNGSNAGVAYFNSADRINFISYDSGVARTQLSTTQVFRDTNAWYHVVFAYDSTLATADDRHKLWINGEQVTSFATRTNPSQNGNFWFGVGGSNYPIRIGSEGSGNYFDGYLAHFHRVDSQALDETVFGSYDTSTNIWKPKTNPSITYTGTSDFNFFLDFADSSNLGNDISGENNDLSASGNMTQTIDTPSNVFATLNPLCRMPSDTTFSNGNTSIRMLGGEGANSLSTLGASKGKYYWEAKLLNWNSTNSRHLIGINTGINSATGTNQRIGQSVDADSIGYSLYLNDVYQNGSQIRTSAQMGGSVANNDIYMFALDLDNYKFYIGRNGSWLNSGVPTSGSTGTGSIGTVANDKDYFVATTSNNNDGNNIHNNDWDFNFGNGYFGTTAVASAGTNSGIGTFEFDVPNGYKALCSKSINEQEYS